MQEALLQVQYQVPLEQHSRKWSKIHSYQQYCYNYHNEGLHLSIPICLFMLSNFALVLLADGEVLVLFIFDQVP